MVVSILLAHALLTRGRLLERLRFWAELRRYADSLDYLLKRHIDRYLQPLMPSARVEVDKTLTPGALARPGIHGPEAGDFERLSFGAREQMGVICRPAYAGLLKEAGRPTLIILDGALVHTDEQRLAQMKRVLNDAAQRHQVLLFSCHPANGRDMGVPLRML